MAEKPPYDRASIIYGFVGEMRYSFTSVLRYTTNNMIHITLFNRNMKNTHRNVTQHIYEAKMNLLLQDQESLSSIFCQIL